MAHRVTLVFLLAVGVPHASLAQNAPRIRILDPILRELFEQGITQSPTFRALVEKVETSSILVFVDSDIRMPDRIGARLNFVTSVNGLRYVRVAVDCKLSPRRQVALLAHEFEHAFEIGSRPDIVDVEAMESFYEDFGFQTFENGRHRSFETDAAQATQEAVDEELGQASRPTGHAAY
jgi:hypothetical protein